MFRKIFILLLAITIVIPCIVNAQTSARDKKDLKTLGNVRTVKRYIDWGEVTLYNKTISALITTGTTTFGGIVNFGEDDTGYDVTMYGATSGNYWKWDESEDIVDVVTTRATTSGTERSVKISQTHTGDGAAILEALRVNIASAVQTGSWANAIVGRIAYSGATGDAGGGLAAAMCSEVVLPAISSPAGSYFAHDLEFEAPTSYVANTGNGFNVAYLRFGVYGNTVASFEDEAYFMHVATDFTDASGNMWYDNTLRIQIETTDWFIPLSDAEGEYSSAYQIDISNATDATGTTDGSIQTDGGVGVAKKLYVGTDLAVDGISNLDNTDIDGTFTMDGTAFDVNSTATVTIDNTNTGNGVVINAVTSGSPISIGNATSETTVNDNLTVSGDADVVGAFTAGTVASDAGISGTTATFTGKIDNTQTVTTAANVANMFRMNLTSANTFTGTTGHQFKVYDAANDVVHDGGEHCGVYVNMKLLSAMQSGGKSVLYSGHNYGSGGDYQVIDAGVWLYGNLVDAYKVSGGSIDTGLDLSETTLTNAEVHTSSGAKIFSGSAANGDAVYAEVGAYDATGSIYLSTAAGAIYIQVANAGAAADWYKCTSTDAD